MLSRLALTLLGACATLAQASDLVSLTPDDFDSVVDGSSNVLVKFFAPWCGHCKSMAPGYEQVATAFKKYDDVVIAEVDADAHKSLGGRFGVTGFPTLKWFPKGSTEAVDYSGGRDEDTLVTYVNGKAGTRAFVPKEQTPSEHLTDATFDKLYEEGQGSLVMFHAPWCGHCKALSPKFDEAAKAFANEKVILAKFDADKYKKVPSEYDVSGYPTLKYIPADCTSSSCAEPYSGAREAADLVKFVNSKEGTDRLVNGLLSDTAGRDSELDEYAETFLASTDKPGLLKEASELAQADEYDFYIKVMKKIIKLGDEGATWVVKDIARLMSLVEGTQVTVLKKDEFKKRINILTQFAVDVEDHDEL